MPQKTRGPSSRWRGLCQLCHFSLGLELPRINYTHNGKRYRYVFAAEVQWSPIPTKVLVLGRWQPITIVSVCKAEFPGSQGGQNRGPLGVGVSQKVTSAWDKIHWKQRWTIQGRELHLMGCRSRRMWCLEFIHWFLFWMHVYWAPAMCYNVVGTEEKEVNRKIPVPALKELTVSSREGRAETRTIYVFFINLFF